MDAANPKLIAARLGHSTITITLDRYGHLFPSVEEALAEALDAAFTAEHAKSRRRADALNRTEVGGAVSRRGSRELAESDVDVRQGSSRIEVREPAIAFDVVVLLPLSDDVAPVAPMDEVAVAVDR